MRRSFRVFFGVVVPPEDRAHFPDLFRRGLQEDYGIVEGGKIVARAVVARFASGISEIGAVTTRPAFRNRGCAMRIVGRRAAALHARGKDAMGITTADNAPMRAVFGALGFVGSEIPERDLPS